MWYRLPQCAYKNINITHTHTHARTHTPYAEKNNAVAYEKKKKNVEKTRTRKTISTNVSQDFSMLTIIYRFLRWPAFVYYIIITRRRGRWIVFRPGRARVSKTKIFKRTRVRVFFFITVIICRTYPSRYDGPIRCRARVTDLENNN